MENDNKNNETTPIESNVNLSSDYQIETTEDKYKSDGVVVLGNRNPDNSYSLLNNTMPEQIDIEQRKKEQRELLLAQKKKAQVNKNLTKEAKRVQSIVAIVVLILFIAVIGFFVYRKYFTPEKDFTLKKVHVEFGNPASLHISDYVNNPNPDEKLYILDLSEFIPDKIGEYKYRISYNGITKTGIIEVSDTEAPDVTLQEVKLNMGDTYTPDMFIKECKDFSTCIYTFEDNSAIKTATQEGRNTVNIIVKDKIGNQITKQGTINIKSTDIVLTCEKDNEYDYNAGYKITEKYEVLFDKNYVYKSTNLNKSFTYIDNNNYLTFKKENQSNNYTYDDAQSKVTTKNPANINYGENNDLNGIRNYFETQNYKCKIELIKD